MRSYEVMTIHRPELQEVEFRAKVDEILPLKVSPAPADVGTFKTRLVAGAMMIGPMLPT